MCTSMYDGNFTDFHIGILTNFAFEINLDSSNNSKSYNFKRMARIKKYSDRGFNIRNSYELNTSIELEIEVFGKNKEEKDRIIRSYIENLANILFDKNLQLENIDCHFTSFIFSSEKNVTFKPREFEDHPTWVYLRKTQNEKKSLHK